MASTPLSGLTGMAGINAVANPDPFATPEQRYGGAVNWRHYRWGEQARPYSWQSRATPAGSMGPFGLENQLIEDEFWFLEPSGSPEQDPEFDYNMPNLTRSHGAPNNKIYGVRSQYESICEELDQWQNHAVNPNSSKNMTNIQEMDPLQDKWVELWEVNGGNSDVPATTKQIAFQAGGFGVNDAPSNTYRKANAFGWGDKHMHRRYAVGPIPGNYMYLKPQGRPLFKTMAGPARPAIGYGSPFQGDDLGDAFAYDTGATLLNTPEEYIPPPAPLLQTRNPTYDNAYGTDGFGLW